MSDLCDVFNLKLNGLLEMKQAIEAEFFEMEQRTKNLKKIERKLQTELWKKCSHKWKRQEGASDDDLCKDKCDICGVCNNRYLYN